MRTIQQNSSDTYKAVVIGNRKAGPGWASFFKEGHFYTLRVWYFWYCTTEAFSSSFYLQPRVSAVAGDMTCSLELDAGAYIYRGGHILRSAYEKYVVCRVLHTLCCCRSSAAAACTACIFILKTRQSLIFQARRSVLRRSSRAPLPHHQHFTN